MFAPNVFSYLIAAQWWMFVNKYVDILVTEFTKYKTAY